MRSTDVSTAESHFIGDRREAWKGSSIESVVWRFHVEMDWTRFGGVKEVKDVDVWNPRIECNDADEYTGQPIYGWEYDRLTDAATGKELSEHDHDSFSEGISELLRDTDPA